MAKLLKNKNISGITLNNESSSSSSNNFSTVSNTATSNGKSWNTSHVSKGTRKALKNAEKPFSSQYSDYLSSVLSKINNRKDFTYDLNGDALYQQYADQYKALGNQAMQETMANASALSGGYANSYATTAGQQAYNSYLQQLNDIVPDLYAQARSNYDAETDSLYNQANLYAGLESDAYSRWSDNRNYFSDKYNNEWSRNAVSHSSQTDKSTQTERSSSSTVSSGSSTSTSYAPSSSSSSLVLPSYEEIKDALTKEEGVSRKTKIESLGHTYGFFEKGMLTADQFKANGKKDNDGTAYDNYVEYASQYLGNLLDTAYTKKSRKNSKNTKGSE